MIVDKQWLVTVTPVNSMAKHLHYYAVVISAPTRTAALDRAVSLPSREFEPDPNYRKPTVRQLEVGKVYAL